MRPMTMMLKKSALAALAPLHIETERLRLYLEDCRDPYIVKLDNKLRAARAERSETTAGYRATCEAHRAANSNKDPTLSMLATEEIIRKQDEQIGVMRAELKCALLEWAPQYFHDVKEYLAAATPAINEAIEFIEAAARLHALNDEFVERNSIGQWVAPRARRLEDVAKTLRKFTGDKK